EEEIKEIVTYFKDKNPFIYELVKNHIFYPKTGEEVDLYYTSVMFQEEERIENINPEGSSAEKELERVVSNLTEDDLSRKEELLELLKTCANFNRADIAFYLCKKGFLNSSNFIDPMFSWIEKALKGSAENKIPSKERIDELALDWGVGYKTANLMIMKAELEKANAEIKEVSKGEQTCSLKVPDFIGLSDFEMQSLLKETYPNLEEDWESFRATFGNPRSMSISKEGEGILNEIQKKILVAFKEKAYEIPSLKLWLEKVDPKLLIVRSTGREDTEENANAGGNASLPFIQPNQKDILTAVSEVVASYFSSKSISQRLIGKDETLFDAPFFIPVLIQEMAIENTTPGEDTPDNLIPRSGVLFTKEHGKHEGVISVSVALGNNEGVVSSKVATDTNYIDPRGKVYSVDRYKGNRLVHNEKNELINQETKSLILAKEGALTPRELKDLGTLSRYMAKYYGDDQKPAAMDIEFTIIRNQDGTSTIYPLQIRPLKELKLNSPPSFIDRKEFSSIEEDKKCKGVTLLAGTSTTLIINKKEELLSEDENLLDALNRYLKMNEESKNEIKGVIVKNMPSATSHEAVMFRSIGLPVIIMQNEDNFQKAQRLSAEINEGENILLCPQRSFFLKASKEDQKKLIKEGMVSYPRPLEYSVPKTISLKNKTEKLVTINTRALILKAEDLSEELKNDLVIPKDTGLFDLIDRMAMGEKKEAEACLSLLLKKVTEIYKKSIRDKNPAMAFFLEDWLNSLNAIINIASKDLSLAFKSPPQSMDRLFYLKQIEAIFLQKNNPEVQRADSLARLLEIPHNLKRAKPLNRFEIACQLVSKQAMNSDTKEKLEIFMTTMPNKDKREFILLILELNQFDILFEWCNHHFLEVYNKDTKTSISDFKKELSLSKDLLQKVKSSKKKLQNIERILPSLSDPKFSHKNLNQFILQFMEEAEIQSFFTDLESSTTSDLGKIAALKFLESAINTYDLAIKSISGSSLYSSPQEKLEDFTKILKGYYFLASFFVKSNESEEIFYRINKAFCANLKEDKPSREEASKEFLAREAFDVRSILIYELDNTYGVVPPKTLEEIFTSFHQFMMQELSQAKSSLIITEEKLDQELFDISKTLKKGCLEATRWNSSGPKSPKLIEVLKNGDSIEVKYELNLRQHAAQLKLTQKQGNEFIKLEVKTFGAEEHERWKQTASLPYLLSNKYNLPLPLSKINYQNPRGASFEIEIPTGNRKQQKDIFKDIYSWLIKGTISHKKGFLKVLEEANIDLDYDNYCDQEMKNLGKSFSYNQALIKHYIENRDSEESEISQKVIKLSKATLKGAPAHNFPLEVLKENWPVVKNEEEFIDFVEFLTLNSTEFKEWWDSEEQKEAKSYYESSHA
ncbi:hypothetical protein AB751O23_BF_00010, partial [Chlamydiales bacterium SCGC AB-751-O23]